MAKVGDVEIESKVFETTKELLIKHGVRGWNMDELAKECGVSKRTLYKIIGNKEDLLYKCNEDDINKEISKRKEFLSYKNESEFKEKLSLFSTYFASSFNEFVLLSAKDLLLEYPRIGDMIEEKKIILSRYIKEFLADGQKLGFINKTYNPDFVSEFIENIIDFNIQKRQSAVAFAEKVKPRIDMIIAGITR